MLKAPSWIVALTVFTVGAFTCLLEMQVSKLVTDADKAIVSAPLAINDIADHANNVIDGFKPTGSKVNTILDGVNGTIANINRKCKGEAGPDACGTLAQLNKTTIQVGDAIKTTQIQVAGSQRLLDSTNTQLATVAAHINKNSDKVTDSLVALVQGGQPLLQDAHSILSNPAIPDMFESTRGILKKGDHVVFTFDAVSTKATHNYLHPSHNPVKRTWDAASPFVYPAVRIGASLTPLW